MKGKLHGIIFSYEKRSGMRELTESRMPGATVSSTSSSAAWSTPA